MAICLPRGCAAVCDGGYYPCDGSCVTQGTESRCDPCPHLPDVSPVHVLYRPDARGPWPRHSVLPIYFVPTDWPIGLPEVHDEAAAMYSALVRTQAFYARELGGETFVLNDLVVLQARRTALSYGIRFNGRNRYEDGVEIVGPMEDRVVAELFERGYPTPPRLNQGDYSVVIFVKGAGGWAGGRAFPSATGGWAILGDWNIDSLDGTLCPADYWFAGQRRQTGALAHELGHTFGLRHPDVYGEANESSIMGYWWEYPELGFNATDVATLRAGRREYFRVH